MKRIYGLLGRKLGHSYSPLIHKELGNPDYRLIELEPENLADFLKNEDIGGLNVTIPYKLDVMPYCRLSPEAEKIGAVNTIVNRNGQLWGYNTDRDGFQYMVQKAGIDMKDKKVLVLGSGGASRTAVHCSESLGAREVVVISRSHPENNYDNLAKHADGEVIINCTPVGMFPKNGESPVDLAVFPKCCGVVDVIYNPLRTKLIMQAEKLGIPHIGGLHMLTAQAKRAAELFFDKEIPDSENDAITAKITQSCENIVLIGMPGGGKSTVGKLLGKLTGRPVYETDDMIVETSGKTIPKIFAQDGEEIFRQLEHQVICEAGKKSGSIIITGGGVVTRPENYEPLHQNGRIYEITRDIEKLAMGGRPLSTGREALYAMYEKRHPLYVKFRDCQAENEHDAMETAQWIWRDFSENSCN
ncbi:MAG: shikimate kinase [Ruminococcaceae bacterium]|nr:shikimate kinase [Oscillospiraceae bacterium]